MTKEKRVNLLFYPMLSMPRAEGDGDMRSASSAAAAMRPMRSSSAAPVAAGWKYWGRFGGVPRVGAKAKSQTYTPRIYFFIRQFLPLSFIQSLVCSFTCSLDTRLLFFDAQQHAIDKEGIISLAP